MKRNSSTRKFHGHSHRSNFRGGIAASDAISRLEETITPRIRGIRATDRCGRCVRRYSAALRHHHYHHHHREHRTLPTGSTVSHRTQERREREKSERREKTPGRGRDKYWLLPARISHVISITRRYELSSGGPGESRERLVTAAGRSGRLPHSAERGTRAAANSRSAKFHLRVRVRVSPRVVPRAISFGRGRDQSRGAVSLPSARNGRGFRNFRTRVFRYPRAKPS